MSWMHTSRADYTNTYRDLSEEELPADERYRDPAFLTWHRNWQLRLDRDGRSIAAAVTRMRAINPAIIPRNHLVEEALSAAEAHDDLSVLHDLLTVLASPYEHHSVPSKYREPPLDESSYRTHCGT